MAAKQLVQARIDGAVKEEAATVLAAMGLTVSDAVRLLLTKVAQEKALPFEPLIPNPVTIGAMKEARKGRPASIRQRAGTRGRSACGRLSRPPVFLHVHATVIADLHRYGRDPSRSNPSTGISDLSN